MLLSQDFSIIDRQTRFMAEHFTSPKGNPYSTKGREEFVNWYLSSLNGWKIGKNVPVYNPETYLDAPICESCAENLGEITFDFSFEYQCPETPCVGLRAFNIWLIFLHADRRVGKTFNTGAYIVERLLRGRNYRARYIASGEKHTAELSQENIEGIVTRNAELGDGRVARQLEILKGKALTNRARNNKLTLVSSSGPANLGAGLSNVFIDEAKVVNFDVVNKLLPSIQEMHGWKCLICGWEYTGLLKPIPEQCPECGKSNHGLELHARTLVPWNARAVFMSNAGTVSGDALFDWFDLMVGDLMERPSPHVVVGKFDDNSQMNPDVHSEVKTIAMDLIGRVPGLESASNEWLNDAKMLGTPFVEEWAHCYDTTLNNVEGLTYEPLIAFLDTARTTDLVSITAVRDVTPENDPRAWNAIEDAYVEWWDPQDPKSDITVFSHPEGKRVVDEDRMFAKMVDILVKWPNIQMLWVDTRFSRQSERLIQRLRNMDAPFSSVIFPYEGLGDDRDSAYSILENKIAHNRYRMQYMQRLDAEFKKAVWAQAGKRMTVRERGRSNNEAQRRKNHLDLLEGKATVCLMAFQLSVNAGHVDSIVKTRTGAMGRNMLAGPKARGRAFEAFDAAISRNQPAGMERAAFRETPEPATRARNGRRALEKRLGDF